MFRSTGITLCCLALIGCQSPKMTLYDDGAAMQRQVAELVPPGTPVAEAKKTMRDNGFNCSERTPPKNQPTDGTEEPCLLCQYGQMAGIFGHYQLNVKFPYTEDGCVGEPTIDKLDASSGLSHKEHPASDGPCPIEPAPLWTKIVAGTAIAAAIIITVPIACLALSQGCGCGH